MARPSRASDDGEIAIEVVSVNVGRPEVLLEHSTGTVMSAIRKRPVSEPSLLLDALNLEGDQQADTRPTPSGDQVHGGPDQAVYAYPSEHYPKWADELGLDVFPGLFGENLTI